MRELRLTQGYVALVDDEDYERASLFSWHVKIVKTKYGTRKYAVGYMGGKGHAYLHQFVMGTRDKDFDHKDRDGLNCQKENLRPATNSQNQMNRAKYKNCSSEYKGVGWHKGVGKWTARIKVNRQEVRLGCFDDESQAAKAYDQAAIRYFGEFAVLNFPEMEGEPK